MNISYADPAVLAFAVIPLFLAAALVWAARVACRRTGAPPASVTRATLTTAMFALVWLGVTWVAADSGVLREWDRRPPPLMLLLVAIVVVSAGIAFSSFGRRLADHISLWALVAVQGFRLPLELAMHEMAKGGIMPVQMTYTGRNFDIVTGATAVVVALLLRSGRAGRAVALAWNVLGLALLLNVVVVAILATPVFRYFGDASLNTWVTYTPFVWLPAVMVPAAFAGHLVIFRAIRHSR